MTEKLCRLLALVVGNQFRVGQTYNLHLRQRKVFGIQSVELRL